MKGGLAFPTCLAHYHFKFAILLACSRMENTHYAAAHLWAAGSRLYDSVRVMLSNSKLYNFSHKLQTNY